MILATRFLTPTFLVTSICLCCTGREQVVENDFDRRNITETVTPVITFEAKLDNFEQSIRTTGKVEAVKDFRIKANVSGVISDLFMRNGQTVKKGELLARIDSRIFTLDFERAKIQLMEKKLAYEDMMLSYTGTALEAKDTIKENIRHSSGLALAENQYKRAKLDYENTFIKAPISGVIADLSVKSGEQVEYGRDLVSIYDPTQLIVTCDILESDIARITTGLPATVQALSEANSRKARVSSINPRVDKSGLTNICLEIEDPQNLYPGMNVIVTIKILQEKAILIPKQALVNRSGQNIVFIEENGVCSFQYVEIGKDNGEMIEIVDGVNVGQQIIISNNLNLAHENRVTVTERRNY